MIGLRIYRERIVLALLGIIVFSFVAFLLLLNHQSRIDLQTAERTTFIEAAKRSSENLRFFFDDRKNDLEDISVSTPLQGYFANKDLGMSLQYGLMANLEDVARDLKRLLETRRFGDFGRIYKRIILADSHGTPLIDLVPGQKVIKGLMPSHEPIDLPAFEDEPSAHVCLEAGPDGGLDLSVHRPLFHKGRFVGHLTAQIDRSPFVIRQLSMPSAGMTALIDTNGRVFDERGIFDPRDSGAPALHESSEDEDSIVKVVFPIPDTPFDFVAAVEKIRLFKTSADDWTIGSLYGLALLLLISGIVIWRNGLKREILQQELREAQKLEAVGQLAGGIAHEINTPSQYIGNNLKFLADAHRDLFALLDRCLSLVERVRAGREHSEDVAEIDTATKDADLDFLRDEVPAATEQSLYGMAQVSRIVLAMKEFSHPGGNEKAIVDLNHAIENTITISRNAWKHVAKVETDLDSSLPLLTCHPGEINQVLLNVIVNAAHAVAAAERATETGKITVSTRLEGRDAVVRIRDNGIGIHESIQDKIFNPFFTTKMVGKGTGQGLAITRDIVVNKHGGSISFETKDGKGTTFIIRLPIIDTDGPRRPVLMDAQSAGGLNSCRSVDGL